MSKDNAIKIDNVCFSHGNKKILNNVSFEIPKGRIIGLVGPNGTGKTTLLKLMSGLYTPEKGNISVLGYDMSDSPVSVYNSLGVMIEDTASYENLTGYENIKILSGMYKMSNSHEEIENLFKLAGIHKVMNDKVKTYSLGMKKRLGIIMTLLNKPKVILLDEPTNGLDIDGIRDVRGIIKDYSRNYSTTTIVSSHIVGELEKICDTIIFMINGSIKSINDITDFNSVSIEEYYVKLVEESKYA